MLGSKVGSETIASTLPVRRLERDDGALDAGTERWSPSYAACWAFGLSVSSTLPPLGGVVAEQVDEAVDEQPRVVAGQHGVLGALDAGLGRSRRSSR